MAESKIQNTRKTGSVSGSVNRSINVRQDGNVVTVNGYTSVTLTARTDTPIGTISGVDLPKEVIRGLAGVASGAYQHPDDVAYIAIATTGLLYMNSSLSGSKAIWFSLSYVV